MLVEGRHVTQDINVNQKSRRRSGRSRGTPRRKSRTPPDTTEEDHGTAQEGEGPGNAPPPTMRDDHTPETTVTEDKGAATEPQSGENPAEVEAMATVVEENMEEGEEEELGGRNSISIIY